MVDHLEATGLTRSASMGIVAAKAKVSLRTLWRWHGDRPLLERQMTADK